MRRICGDAQWRRAAPRPTTCAPTPTSPSFPTGRGGTGTWRRPRPIIHPSGIRKKCSFESVLGNLPRIYHIPFSIIRQETTSKVAHCTHWLDFKACTCLRDFLPIFPKIAVRQTVGGRGAAERNSKPYKPFSSTQYNKQTTCSTL